MWNLSPQQMYNNTVCGVEHFMILTLLIREKTLGKLQIVDSKVLLILQSLTLRGLTKSEESITD